MKQWSVIIEPLEENKSTENTGGVILYLTDGEKKCETTRVAYVRRASKNPKVKFDEQLKLEVQRAQVAADELNELERNLETAAKDAAAKVKAKTTSELEKARETVRTLRNLDFDELERVRAAVEVIQHIDVAQLERAKETIEPFERRYAEEIEQLEADLAKLDERRKSALRELTGTAGALA